MDFINYHFILLAIIRLLALIFILYNLLNLLGRLFNVIKFIILGKWLKYGFPLSVVISICQIVGALLVGGIICSGTLTAFFQVVILLESTILSIEYLLEWAKTGSIGPSNEVLNQQLMDQAKQVKQDLEKLETQMEEIKALIMSMEQEQNQALKNLDKIKEERYLFCPFLYNKFYYTCFNLKIS